MLVNPNVEKLLKKCDNRYELVIAVSKRARQIQEKDLNGIESKVTRAAIEFNNGDCYIVGRNEE